MGRLVKRSRKTGDKRWIGTATITGLLLLLTVNLDAGSDLEVRRSSVTGRASSVVAAGGGTIPLPAGTGGGESRVMDFVAHYGHLFGVHDPQRQLEVHGTRTDRLGHTQTTLHQVHRGVPVFSGVLKVHQDADGQVIAAFGDVYPIGEGYEIEPLVDARTAGRMALARVVALQPRVEHNELVIVDPGWYGDPPIGPRLAHHVVVVSNESGVVEAFFVDAHSGAILDRWSLVGHDRQRRVYNGEGAAGLPGRLARAEGDPPAGPVGDPVADDINFAYDYMGDTYAFFAHAFGRDSLDDLGLPLVATVNSTAAGSSCPSAFFYGDMRQIVFCLGRVPDDVVAHELTHGITHFTAALIYQNQSGSLNEHFSFAFGETVDLFNSGSEVAGHTAGPPQWSGHLSGAGLDTPNTRRTACSRAPDYPDGVRWLYNEDRVLYEGAVYDYWDPTCFGHPDRAWSPLQTCPVSNRGGTHLGAAIPNHAYALLSDGGTFNGVEVEGIGLTKAAAIWYRALTTYLTPASDFEDAYWAFNRAAADLVGTSPNDPRTGMASSSLITAVDALQVEAALRAVEMDTPGRCGQGVDVLDPDPAPECDTRSPIFDEYFEEGLPDGWTVSNVGSATPYDWRVTDPGEGLPFDRPGRAAFCPDPDSSCLEADESGAHRLDSPVIALPTDLHFPTLAFTHLVGTEPLVDGGNLEIRVGDGDWQPIPAGALYHNGYNQVLATAAQGNTNPLAGEPAFSGGGGRWGTSLVHLGRFVSGGEEMRIRFELGKDSCSGAHGWYLDDVRVYDCTASEDCDNNGVPDEVQTAEGAHPDVVVHHASAHGDGEFSDADRPPGLVNVQAQRFDLMVAKTLHTVRVWGWYYPYSTPGGDFTVVIHHDGTGAHLPGAVISAQSRTPATHALAGFATQGIDEWEITLELVEPVTLEVGTYWLEIFADTAGDDDTFVWSHAEYSRGLTHVAFARQAPGASWYAGGSFHHAVEIEADIVGADCNANGSPDACDIASGIEEDDDGNGIPDRCQPQAPRRPTGRVGG